MPASGWRGCTPRPAIPNWTPCSAASRTICSTSARICACPETGEKLDYEPLRIIAAQTKRIEADIDALNADLQPLKSFILPGGSPAAAALHLARTVTRRAERAMVALAQDPAEHVNREAIRYVNRVSDFLFVAGRVVNDNGNADVLWVPGKNR